MKNSLKCVNQRRQDIIQLLKDHHRLSVSELSNACHVSLMTIRRDLNELSNQGLVKHGHGYAEFINNTPYEGDTKNQPLECIKQQLAKQAAKYTKSDETIFINSSSTAIGVLNYIQSHRNTIITNNVEATKKTIPETCSLILTGGEVRFPKEALIGQIAMDYLHHVYSDITFIGCSGISKDGITSNNLYESQINQMMIQHTHHKNVVVVADYRKIGMNSNFPSAMLSDIRYLITDIHADAQAIKEIESAGVTVIQI